MSNPINYFSLLSYNEPSSVSLILTQQMLLMLLDMERFRWSVAALQMKRRNLELPK
jgi:hypothetical protein